MVLENKNYFVNSPSFFLVFKYIEPLSKKFELLKIYNRGKKSDIIFKLISFKTNVRKIQLVVTDKLSFTYEQTYEAGKKHQLEISLIENQSLFEVMIN